MIIDTNNLVSVLEAIAAVTATVIAWWQHRKTQTVQAAYTPGTPEATTPAIIATLPARSWKMDDSTKQWLTFDATPDNKVTILAQIAAAEEQKLTSYQIHYTGGYYNIEYGLLKGSAGNPSGK